MRTLIAKHKTLWLNKFFVVSTITGILLFSGSLFVNYGAINYATKEAGSSTTDILLDNLPVINTDFIFTEGAFVFIILTALLLALKPKTIPLTLKSVALFIVVRSIFVIMTHLGPVPNSITPDLNSFQFISSGADLFFSGHTGLPFLMALLFWDNKYIKLFFLFCSIVAAVAVILGHLHYTIDVFSAFFITYGIYNLALYFFKKDRKLFVSSPDFDINSGLV